MASRQLKFRLCRWCWNYEMTHIVYVPLQKSIEEPEPSPSQTVEIAMKLEVSVR